MLRVASEHADSWSSFGGYQIETVEELLAATRDRCNRFDDLCIELGRDPKGIRHSLVCFPPLTPWVSAGSFTDMVGRFSEIGIDEFVLYWPGHHRPESGGVAVGRHYTSAVSSAPYRSAAPTAEGAPERRQRDVYLWVVACSSWWPLTSDSLRSGRTPIGSAR